MHAGSDWQSDINGDSPNDIPTFFVTLGTPQDLTSTDTTTGAPGALSECSIIPETTNQDGFPGSIAAAFYHEFGHALGLPDVYSTGTGLPSVGIWDLMDSGTNLPVTLGTITAENDTFVISATGVLPPSLSAWNKWYLGWLETHELDGSKDEWRLPAVGVRRDQYFLYDQVGDFDLSYPQVYRAGSSTRDYFLLENRWVAAGPERDPVRRYPVRTGRGFPDRGDQVPCRQVAWASWQQLRALRLLHARRRRAGVAREHGPDRQRTGKQHHQRLR